MAAPVGNPDEYRILQGGKIGSAPGGETNPTPPTDVPFYGWPNVNVFYMTTDNTNAIKNGGVPTPLTLMMRRTPIQLMQGGDFFTQSQRNQSVPFWTSHHAASVPGAVLVNHRFAKTTKGIWPVGDTSQGQIAWDAIFKDKIPNALLTRGNGDMIGSENDPCFWLFNFSPEPQGAGKYFADRHIAIHDELVAAIDGEVHIYYDGFPNLNVDKLAQQLHGGAISSIPSVGVVRVPYWNYDISTLPDAGDGYKDVSTAFGGKGATLMYRNIAAGRAGGNSITGVKHNGTSSTDIRWNTSQNDPSLYPQAGDLFSIMNQDRSGYAADWNNDGVDENRTDATQARVRERAKIDFMTYQSDAMQTRWGYYGWRGCNGLATSARLKDNGVNPWLADDESYDSYDWPSFESANNGQRFDAYDGTGFNVKFWSVEQMVRAMYYGRQWLELSQWDSTYQVFNNSRCPYPFVCPAVEAGQPAHATGSNDWSSWIYYSDPANPESRLLAAFNRFWWGLCMSMRHAFPAFCGEANSSEPWVVEEVFLSLGRPADEANRELGTYDRSLPGDQAFAYRTPDFGTRGFVTIFENYILAINCEEPTLANGGKVVNGNNEYWTPGYGAYGTACDFDSFLPAGKTAVNFNSASLTCTGASPGDPRDGYQPGQDPYCSKDPIWNNGQPTGVQLLSPMEVRVAEIVDV